MAPKPQGYRSFLWHPAACEYKYTGLGRCQYVTVHLLKRSQPSTKFFFFYLSADEVPKSLYFLDTHSNHQQTDLVEIAKVQFTSLFFSLTAILSINRRMNRSCWRSTAGRFVYKACCTVQTLDQFFFSFKGLVRLICSAQNFKKTFKDLTAVLMLQSAVHHVLHFIY